MMLIAVFILFVFSTLGLSMLFISQIYLKLSAYKKNSLILEYASENGIKQGFTQLTNILSQVPSPIILTPEDTEMLRGDALNQGTEIIETLLAAEIPLAHSETWEKLSWESRTDFSLMAMIEKDNYFHTTYSTEIGSRGMLEGFRPHKDTDLEASMEVSTGHIPLPQIPLLINKPLNPEQRENFLEENKIEFLPSKYNNLNLRLNVSEEELLPQDAYLQLRKALKIEIFYPQNLSNPQLRTALGLEVTNDPVPDGVYLVEDDLGLGGAYVQGDLDQLILAIEDDFQVISFHSADGIWILKYNPTQMRTEFSTPTETHSYDLIPQGIIIVNGEIRSLGGGIVDPTGNITLTYDEEIPCILRGVNLTIISSSKISLSSHLIHQGVTWEEGVPYIKDSNSQLHIFAAGKDFVESTERDGQIVISGDAPQDIYIQASLTASNKGISIEGENKTVNIFGSIQTKDYIGSGNNLKLLFDERFLGDEDTLQNAPRTVNPILSLTLFKLIEWRDN